MGIVGMDVDQLFVFKDRMILSLHCLVSPKPNLLEKYKTEILRF